MFLGTTVGAFNDFSYMGWMPLWGVSFNYGIYYFISLALGCLGGLHFNRGLLSLQLLLSYLYFIFSTPISLSAKLMFVLMMVLWRVTGMVFDVFCRWREGLIWSMEVGVWDWRVLFLGFMITMSVHPDLELERLR